MSWYYLIQLCYFDIKITFHVKIFFCSMLRYNVEVFNKFAGEKVAQSRLTFAVHSKNEVTSRSFIFYGIDLIFVLFVSQMKVNTVYFLLSLHRIGCNFQQHPNAPLWLRLRESRAPEMSVLFWSMSDRSSKRFEKWIFYPLNEARYSVSELGWPLTLDEPARVSERVSQSAGHWHPDLGATVGSS